MMRFSVLDKERIGEFKRKMQNAFQTSAESSLGSIDGTVLPEEDIDQSLSAPGAIAYSVTDDGELVGGAIVAPDDEDVWELHFLFVDADAQNRGIGRFLWNGIEKEHDDVKKWVTHTPYFDRRNIHFYINVCGFSATEFYCEHHPGKEEPTEMDGKRGTDLMFRFEKVRFRCRSQFIKKDDGRDVTAPASASRRMISSSASATGTATCTRAIRGSR